MNDDASNLAEESIRKQLQKLLDKYKQTHNCSVSARVEDVKQYITLIGKKGEILFHDKISIDKFNKDYINLFEYVKQLDSHNNLTFKVTK